MPKVVHFEITADNPERAVKFYTQAFGWKIEKWAGGPDYWMMEGDKKEMGIGGAIMKRDGLTGVVDYIGVPSVEEAVKKIKAAGGKILVPKTEIPKIGYFAHFKDSEGNMLGVFEPMPGSMM